MKKALCTILFVAMPVGLCTIFKSHAIEESKKEAEIPIVDTQEHAIAMLNDLIAKNAAFSIQIAHPELAIKAKIWQRRGKLTLPPTIPWETFKQDAHQFGVDLYTLLEQDAKGTYYHIEELRKNTALYNELAKLNQAIPQGKKEGEDESIGALGNLPSRQLLERINLYVTRFYSQKLLVLLKAFFEKFEERAKKMRRAQEEAQKKAEGAASTSWFEGTDFDSMAPDFDRDRSFDLDTTDDDLDRPEVIEQETGIDWGF